MKKLILATASAIALGIAGASPLYAADTNATANSPPASTAMQPAAPSSNAAEQQTPATNTNSSMSGSNQYGNADTAGTSQSEMGSQHMSRSDVRQVQEKLHQDGLYHGRIDGLMGPETQQALRHYQQKNGLPATGTADQQTMASLLGTGAGVGMGSSTPPSYATTPNVSPNSNAGTTGATSAPANSAAPATNTAPPPANGTTR